MRSARGPGAWRSTASWAMLSPRPPGSPSSWRGRRPTRTSAHGRLVVDHVGHDAGGPRRLEDRRPRHRRTARLVGGHVSRRRRRGRLGAELLERLPGTRRVDRGGAAVHEQGDAQQLGHLAGAGPGPGGGLGVVSDAAVAALDHRDGERGRLLQAGGHLAVGHGRVVQRHEAGPRVGDGAAQALRRWSQVSQQLFGIHGALLDWSDARTGRPRTRNPRVSILRRVPAPSVSTRPRCIGPIAIVRSPGSKDLLSRAGSHPPPVRWR